MILLKRLALASHRWTGVAFCLLFCWWFISGIFMMCWDYPEVKPADRLAHAAPLDASRVRGPAEQAWARLGGKGMPDSVRLEMLDGRPAYWFRAGRSQAAVYADTGELQTSFPDDLNQRTASSWAHQPASSSAVEVLKEEDQWTVGSLFTRFSPLAKYTFPDGQQVYLAKTTGEVVQYTTKAMRLGAYLGPIPHWLYFTPLRKQSRLWNRVVIGLSGAATLVALLGLVAGLTMYSASKRYRREGLPTSIPYAGPKRLHMILGLFFGLIACTWSFSGMLSMEPFPLDLGGGEDARIPEALEPQPFRFEGFSREALMAALAPGVKRIDFLRLAGESYYLASGNAAPRLVPELSRDKLLQLVQRAGLPEGVAETTWLTAYNAHYLDRNKELPLPVLSVRMKDPQASEFYIDPRSARITGSYNRNRWPERWAYHALHSLNFPWLYQNRPAWEIVVLFLLLGGTALSVTSVLIGGQLLWRKVSRKRPEASSLS